MAYTARSSTSNPWTPPSTQSPVGAQIARWKGLGDMDPAALRARIQAVYNGGGTASPGQLAILRRKIAAANSGLGSVYSTGEHFPLPYGSEPWTIPGVRGLGSEYRDWNCGDVTPVQAASMRPSNVTRRLRVAMGALPAALATPPKAKVAPTPAKPAAKPVAAATTAKASPTSTKPTTPAVATAAKTTAVKANPAALRPANAAQGIASQVAAGSPSPATSDDSGTSTSSGLFGLSDTELLIGGAVVLIGGYFLLAGGSSKRR